MADNKSPTFGQQLTERLIAFTNQIILIVETLPDNRVGSHIATQLLRAGSSAAPNYAEALSAESRKDFIHKISIALKELRETHVWLKTIEKRSLLSETLLACTIKECDELMAILFSSILTARRNLSKHEGPRQPIKPHR